MCWEIELMDDRQRILQDAAGVRDKAQALLRGLVEARVVSERHLGSGVEMDAMKRVTGRSSMENAIASTKRMVESLERTLEQLKKELSEEDAAGLKETV